jgi:hypothetical protein
LSRKILHPLDQQHLRPWSAEAVVKNHPRQYDCGWYAFNDAIGKIIGPFKTPTAAKRSCPLVA